MVRPPPTPARAGRLPQCAQLAPPQGLWTCSFWARDAPHGSCSRGSPSPPPQLVHSLQPHVWSLQRGCPTGTWASPVPLRQSGQARPRVRPGARAFVQGGPRSGGTWPPPAAGKGSPLTLAPSLPGAELPGPWGQPALASGALTHPLSCSS